MSPLNPDELLSTQRARAVLPMSTAWFSKNSWLGPQIGDDYLPHVKIGNRRLYRRGDLDNYIQRHAKPTAPAAAPAVSQEGACMS